LGSQRFPINKEGLGYIPKKGKAAFVTPKPSFVKSNGRFCYRCKQVGHVEQDCKVEMNKPKHVAYAPYPKNNIKRNHAYMYHAKNNKGKNVAMHQPKTNNAKMIAYIPPHKRNNNKKLVARVPPPFFDASYVLFKAVNGVKARFIGKPMKGTKKNAIWVPKSLVTNLQGPKLAWVPKTH
jgi:hypothetical protein